MKDRQRPWHLTRVEWTALIVAGWLVLAFASS